MTTREALDWVKDNWSTLEHRTIEGHEAVWFINDDIADAYEVDRELIGMKGDGSLVWAYASGCSCWDGEYDAEPIKDIKVFEFKHQDLSEKWEKELIEFVTNEQNKQ